MEIAVIKQEGIKDCGDLFLSLKEKPKELLKQEFILFKGYEFFLKYKLKRCEHGFAKDKLLKESVDFLRGIEGFFIQKDLVKIASEVFGVNEKVFYAKKSVKDLKIYEDLHLKACVKTALNQEDFRLRFEHYLYSYGLKLTKYQKPYEDFKNTGNLSQELLALLNDERIVEFKEADYKLALKELVKKHYQKALKQSLKAKDYKGAYAFSKEIIKLSEPF